MILGPISYLDCLVFCVFLAPQLLLEIGVIETVKVLLHALPFLVIQLPIAFVYERNWLRPQDQSAFARQATPFADIVIRCVRYAFANIPPSVGRVFFGRNVALPWLRWRMLRHGYLKSPVHWREHRNRRFKGVWAIHDPSKDADLIIYYAHGGGFSMGSTYFYLEFLFAWLGLLQAAGYANPAVFSIDYTLVPDASFPTQLDEVLAGYEHVLHTAAAAATARVCVAGDSAGGTLVLSLLLRLAKNRGAAIQVKPDMAVLISPWTTLHSPLHSNNASDYLDVDALRRYAALYAAAGSSGGGAGLADPLASPGDCVDLEWWREAQPRTGGVFVTYGKHEVFAPEIEKLERTLRKAGWLLSAHGEERPGIHAWPVVSLFLGDSREERLKGLRRIVSEMQTRVPPSKNKEC